MVKDIWFLHDIRITFVPYQFQSLLFTKRKAERKTREEGEIINLFTKDTEPPSTNPHSQNPPNKPQNVNINFRIDFSVISMCLIWNSTFEYVCRVVLGLFYI